MFLTPFTTFAAFPGWKWQIILLEILIFSKEYNLRKLYGIQIAIQKRTDVWWKYVIIHMPENISLYFKKYNVIHPKEVKGNSLVAEKILARVLLGICVPWRYWCVCRIDLLLWDAACTHCCLVYKRWTVSRNVYFFHYRTKVFDIFD